MVISHVSRLADFGERRAKRLAHARALAKADPGRSTLLEYLATAIERTEADRAAVLWLDEYDPRLVHVHCLLDLVRDVPRRGFSVPPWYSGGHDDLTSFIDTPRVSSGNEALVAGVPKSTCHVSIGCDGTRAWFLAVDSVTPRTELPGDSVEELMFLAGEAAAVVLHRDLDPNVIEREYGNGAADSSEGEVFSGWMILKDLEGREDDSALDRRIATRFLVGRAARAALDEELAIDAGALHGRIARIESDFGVLDQKDPERVEWSNVLRSLGSGDHEQFGRSLLELADCLDRQGHLFGSAEFFKLGHDVAVACGSGSIAGESARFLGRTHRRLGEWEESVKWYEVARHMGEVLEDRRLHALALGGMGHTQREKGNLPGAFESHRESLEQAEALGDAYVQGFAHHNLMTDEKLAGEISKAIQHGWEAVQLYPSEPDRLRALTDLAWAFVEGGDLCAAEDAYVVVAHKSEDFLYRAYSLAGLAYIEALRGDEKAFRVRIDALDETPWRSGSPFMVSELHLNRGRAYRLLGDYERAAEWLEQAKEFSAEHGNNQVTFQAEAEMKSLRSGDPVGGGAPAPQTPTTLEGVAGVRDGLSVLRQELELV